MVRRFFDTLGTGDFAAIGEFFTDDSVWRSTTWPAGCPAQHGRKGIIDDFLQPIREGLFEPGDPKVEIRRLIGEGDWVVAETTARGTLLNGNHYENAYVFVIEVAGGTVKFLREYMDSDYAHSVSAGAGRRARRTGTSRRRCAPSATTSSRRRDLRGARLSGPYPAARQRSGSESTL